MTGKKKLVFAVFFPLLFGCLALNQTLSRPRLRDIRTVDIVTLVAAGACFGAALTAFFAMMAWNKTVKE
jgi:hypothetical protein